MGKAFDVSANIGFDGSSYFCKRCGKAGYGKATQVRGHLALCPGTLLRRGGTPTTTSNHLQPVATGYDGGLSGVQLLQPVVAVDPVANPVGSQPVGYQQLASQVATMAGQVATMQNHYNHVMSQVNQSQQSSVNQDFFSRYKAVIIVGAIILFAYLLSEQSKGCQAVSGAKGVDVVNLGAKALGKALDVSITKGVASLFK